MKVKVKRVWSNGSVGYEFGDVMRLDDNYIYYATLNAHRAAPYEDLIEISPNEGYYSDSNLHLIKSKYWKKIPKKKIKLMRKK